MRAKPEALSELPIAGGLQNVIGGGDERELIEDTRRVPARSIALLEIQPEFGENRYGTAWLIGPRTLATAAHNLIHPVAGQTRALEVGVSYDGQKAHGGWHKAIDCQFPTEWRNNQVEGSPYDFAVLKIEDPSVGNRQGWFGFADYEDAKFSNMIVNIFGYPLDLRRFFMYGAAGRVSKVDAGRIYYDCDAGGGMSGGPVIARLGEQRIAVGVHVAGGVRYNVGTRINDVAYAIFTQYQSWRD